MGLFNGNGKERNIAKVKELLKEWTRQHTEMNAVTKALRMKLTNLQAEIDALSYPHQMRIATLEIQIKGRVSKLGTSVTVEDAKATYRKAYARTSWDSKALNGYAAVRSEILQFKKVSKVKANISIKLS